MACLLACWCLAVSLAAASEPRLGIYNPLHGYDTRPVPRLAAIASNWEQTKQEVPGLDDMDPLALWDLHYVLELEEAHFAEQLAKA